SRLASRQPAILNRGQPHERATSPLASLERAPGRSQPPPVSSRESRRQACLPWAAGATCPPAVPLSPHPPLGRFHRLRRAGRSRSRSVTVLSPLRPQRPVSPASIRPCTTPPPS